MSDRSIVSERLRLVLASFLMLFTELTLIRWVAAYQVHVAYFTNFILLASFLGIGVGFLRVGRRPEPWRWAPAIVAGVALAVFVVRVVKPQDSEGLTTVAGLPAPPMWVTLPLLFGGSVLVMAAIAEGVARSFERFAPLEAYRLDIVGSLGGIVAFSLMSFLGFGPAAWGLVIGVLFLVLGTRRPDPRQLVGAACVILVFSLGSIVAADVWSPYYRVTVSPATPDDPRVGLVVNSLPHQSMLPLERIGEELYALPYTHLGETPADVLIIGAGNGNDVALALANGVERVDAVEIDPAIQDAGRAHHPAGPYDDPRVTPHIDDGRAFLERTDRTYDLILFALPDSLTLVSGQGSLRLESFLFTEEAMTRVRDRLEPGGAFAVYNYYRPHVFARYAHTMSRVFGHDPCIDRVDQSLGPRQQAVLTIGVDPSGIACDARVASGPDAPTPSTDDHPFPYVEGRSIPGLYLWSLAAVLVASIAIVRVSSRAPLRRMAPFADLFCMGAAFMLLETKGVVQFALLFGTTWFVNALVFAGILFAVLAAIEVARRVRLPPPGVMYVALLAGLALAWVVAPASLLSLAPVSRFVAGVVVTFAPIFLANLIFAQRFRDVGASTIAFGANLLGAMLGGVLEYAAIVTGYRALLFLVALLYGAAFLIGRRHLGDRQPVLESVGLAR